MTETSFLTSFRQRRTAVGGVIFAGVLLLVLLGWTFWPRAFFPAYWSGLMFWTQLSIGCLILLLIQFLTGGEWGDSSAPYLRRGAAGLFILLPFFLPAFFGLPHLFSWTQIRPGVSAQVLVNKLAWLNPAAFITRTLFFLVVLTFLAHVWCRPGLRSESPGMGWSGPALVFVVLVLSFASCDWMMSLEPAFYSSLYPFMYFSGAMVSTLAALCSIFSWLQLQKLTPARPDLLHDLGKLFFAAVLFWGYILFSQFIIVWTGNLPDEADWYLVRSHHGWQWLTLCVVLFHFAIPFCLLLSQKTKRNPRRLLAISLAVFLIHFAEIYWLTAPKKESSFHLNPFDVLLPAMIGAAWLWFVTGTAQAPLFPESRVETVS